MGPFLSNWRAYRDEQNVELPDQPLAVSIILVGLGALVPTAMFCVMWTWRPFKWIKPVEVIYSFFAGVMASFAHVQYIVSSNEGVPAVIAGPLSGLCYLIPPLWYWLYDRMCMTKKNSFGLCAFFYKPYMFFRTCLRIDLIYNYFQGVVCCYNGCVRIRNRIYLTRESRKKY